MAKRTSAIDSDPVLSRKRTADLLKQLRSAQQEVRRLKTYIAELENSDAPARAALKIVEGRRADGERTEPHAPRTDRPNRRSAHYLRLNCTDHSREKLARRV
jgi:hypothetical protein